MAYIGLIDCNNFFVSCERLFRPDLKHRPTVVLSSNDGCVVARSQEVKDMGVPMGVPHFKVKEDFQKANVAIFSGNMTLYRDISARVMQVLQSEVGGVEQYSVDEAFFELPTHESDVIRILEHVKKRIEQSVGIPISVGAAKTKTIAKYASEREKKGSGVCFLAGDHWKEMTKSVPMHAIWGVGSETSQKLRSHGVTTVAEFLALDTARIDALFGVGGLRTQSELKEIPARNSERTKDVQKSIMSTRSFKESIFSLTELEAAVAYHVDHVAKQLRTNQSEAGMLRVIARPSRHGDWALRGGAKEVILPKPTSDTRVLLTAAQKLLHTLYEDGVPYKKVGVVVGRLQGTAGRTESLFTAAESVAETQALMQTVDTLNNRLGKGSVMVGRVNQEHPKVRSKSRSPQYTTRWSDIAIAKA